MKKALWDSEIFGKDPINAVLRVGKEFVPNIWLIHSRIISKYI